MFHSIEPRVQIKILFPFPKPGTRFVETKEVRQTAPKRKWIVKRNSEFFWWRCKLSRAVGFTLTQVLAWWPLFKQN
jgi:hypothetical protein